MSAHQEMPQVPQPPASDCLPPVPRLRIAVLNRVFALRGGGAESYSVRIVEELAARHEVHVFAQEIAHDHPGVRYHRIRIGLRKPRWLNQLAFAWATWRATRAGFDIVHSHENTWHGDIHSIHVKSVRQSLLGGRAGVALALRWMKIVLSPRLLTYLGFESSRYSARAGRRVVLASQALWREAAQVYPGAVPRMRVVTPGVRLPAGPAPDRAAARAALGLAHAGPLLLFVANDYARKGLETLLQALPLLPADVALAVVGKGGQIARFRAQGQALGVAERVHFLGPRDDVGPAYDAADVLVHPTREDSFAMVVPEAMAHGLPVVVSAAPWCGISELLRDGQDALLLADPLDAGELAERVGTLLADAAMRRRLRDAGLAFAADHTWAAAAQAFEAIYSESMSGRGAERGTGRRVARPEPGFPPSRE